MSLPTMSTSSGTSFTADYFGRAATATKSGIETDGMLTTLAIGLALLSAICLLLICLLENPWFVALVFVAIYSLFWITLANGVEN